MSKRVTSSFVAKQTAAGSAHPTAHGRVNHFMSAILPRSRLAILLLMPILATCTAAPQRQILESGIAGAAFEDERLGALLIDGVAARSR